MHPVKIDKLLEQTENDIPIKHEDSPAVWVETYVKEDILKCYLVYYADGACVPGNSYNDRCRTLIGGEAFKSNFYKNEVILFRAMLKTYPNWKP